MRIHPPLKGEPEKRGSFLRLAALVWVVVLSIGMFRLMVYDNTPAAVARETPSEWPRNSAVPRNPARNMVVLLAHPRCPCTRASIAELARVMAVCSARTDAVVLFTIPNGTPPGWEKTDLWTAAAAIPGVRALRDAGGVEAARFGGAVSGQCFGFSPSGRKLFEGGITGSRGHEGDNAGEEALMNALLEPASSHSTSPSAPRKAPVFGCALVAP